MIIKVKVKEKVYDIDCDVGTQDIAWLALSATYLYGDEYFPITKFLPSLAKNSNGEVLHPKMNLYKYRETIGNEITVFIKPSSSDNYVSEVTPDEAKWCKQAFYEHKFLMEMTLNFYPATSEYKYAKDINIFMTIGIDVLPSYECFFPEFSNQKTIDFQMEQLNQDLYEKKVMVPAGCATILGVWAKNLKDGERKDILDPDKNKRVVKTFPTPLLPREKEDLIREKEKEVKSKQVELSIKIQDINMEVIIINKY